MKFQKETSALQKETSGQLQKVTGAHGRWYADACGAAFGLELIGERWALLVARELMLGARRFSDLRASLPGISAKTLTDKLDWLEQIGVVERAVLPPPANVKVYALTAWGQGLEEVMQALGRWAVQSPLHDMTLPFSAVSFLLSLRTMFDPARAADDDLWIAFEIGADHFAARLRNGQFTVHRAAMRLPAPDLRFAAPTASAFLPVFYGRKTPEEAGVPLTIEGDPTVAARFIGLFGLPDTISAP
jgi:DNA-binding HxlR family transcriptional regulator